MRTRHNAAVTRNVNRRTFLQHLSAGSVAATIGGHSFAHASANSGVASPDMPFDIATGNAPVEVIVPAVVPAIYSTVSPGANDATLVIRITTMITNVWFDAIAPYHPTAIGVYSNLGRRPASEATDANGNTAIFYASKRVLGSLLPQHAAEWYAMLESVGLDPDDARQDLTSAIGIGNAAGESIVNAREHDGMNQLGDEGGRSHNGQPYADYLGYEAVNTEFELNDPSRWQPQMISDRLGIFRMQRFVTPQMRVTMPYSYRTSVGMVAPPPEKSDPGNPGYKEQADQVLEVSANLTDYQKMAAELFDDKILGLGFSALFASGRHGLSLEGLVQYDFLTNMAAFDAAIATWSMKHRYDAVRPASAIRFLCGDDPVTAWGGPGMGAVHDLPASQWRSYLQTADHPEYPSGSTALCAAHGEASRLYLGTDALGWSVPLAAGSSRIEPGVTPATDMELGPWETWTDFVRECGLSRVWGGVHFMAAVTEGEKLGTPIGRGAYEFLMRHIDGTQT
ncbi:MAG: vanadium-dependent haloperoxidase [Chloroflexia bacterium]|nr:vanadium-dependent haloperoxidase [Chloroflexia bacterium]